MQLRWYQRGAVDSIFAYFAEKPGNPLIVVPTGGGKSLIMGTFIQEACETYPGTRIMVLQHVKELIGQNHKELCEIWPLAPAGIYSASFGKRQSAAQILFAGVQSVRKRAAEIGHVDLVIIDECHMVPREGATTYRMLLAELHAINPFLKVVGLTATHFRLDSGMLHRGEGAMFDDIAYEVDIKTLIAEGYLCPPVSPQGALPQVNTTGIKTQAGEFQQTELAARANDPETVRAICDSICQHGADRAGWLIFGAGKANCALLCDGVRERGYSCETITDETPGRERDAIIAAFKRREIRALSSMGVLTTGFNAQHVDLIACARPTKSPVLWIQMLGRGTRCVGPDIDASRAAGKADFLVLDYGGNIERLGPIDDPRVRKMLPGGKDEDTEVAEGRMKRCPALMSCDSVSPIGAALCAGCGAAFPERAAMVSTEAASGDLLSKPTLPEPPIWFEVGKITYRTHEKQDRPPSMRVTYKCGLEFYDEWVALESADERVRTIASRWWRRHTGGADVPATVADAVREANYGALRKPNQIQVRRNPREPKFWNVVGHQFT